MKMFFNLFCIFNLVKFYAVPESEALEDVATDEGAQNEAPTLEDQLSDESFNVEEKTEEVSEVAEVEAEEPIQDDPVKDEITDKDLEPLNSKNPATNERFQKLTEGYKAERAEKEKFHQEITQYQQSFQALEQLGFNDAEAAQDLINFASYRKALQSGDANTFKQILSEQVHQFALATGQKISLNDGILDGYSDLQEKVSSLELDEQTAHEVARVRALNERATREQALLNQQMQSEQQQQQVFDSAVNEISSYQDYLSKNDPDYKLVVSALQPQLAEIRETVQPQNWAKAIKLRYDSTKRMLIEQSKRTQEITPLRAKASMGTVPANLSLQDALSDENWAV